MKKYIILLAIFTSACTPKGPHIEFICTSEHSEMTIIPMAMPNGNGGVMMTMMPTEISVCDTGFNACINNGVQVSNSLCEPKKI